MSKTVKQLTETTTAKTYDLLHIVDIDNDQDKKIKMSNVWGAKPYGESYVYGNSLQTTVSATNTPYDITNGALFTTTQGITNKFTLDTATGILTYTGEEDIIVEVSAVLSWVKSSASGNAVVRAEIYLNGALANNLSVLDYIGNTTTNNPVTTAINGLLSISNGDTIGLKVQNATDTNNFVISRANLNVKAI